MLVNGLPDNLQLLFINLTSEELAGSEGAAKVLQRLRQELHIQQDAEKKAQIDRALHDQRRHEQENFTNYVLRRREQIRLGEAHGVSYPQDVRAQLLLDHGRLTEQQYYAIQAFRRSDHSLEATEQALKDLDEHSMYKHGSSQRGRGPATFPVAGANQDLSGKGLTLQTSDDGGSTHAGSDEDELASICSSDQEALIDEVERMDVLETDLMPVLVEIDSKRHKSWAESKRLKLVHKKSRSYHSAKTFRKGGRKRLKETSTLFSYQLSGLNVQCFGWLHIALNG